MLVARRVCPNYSQQWVGPWIIRALSVAYGASWKPQSRVCGLILTQYERVCIIVIMLFRPVCTVVFVRGAVDAVDCPGGYGSGRGPATLVILSSDLLHHCSTIRSSFSKLKDVTDWTFKPFVRHRDPTAVLVIDPARKVRVGSRSALLVLGSRCQVSSLLSSDHLGSCPTFWSGLAEKLVDSFHLYTVSDWSYK
jgi:hypothetical protein